jgi:hypothetical protein
MWPFHPNVLLFMEYRKGTNYAQFGLGYSHRNTPKAT